MAERRRREQAIKAEKEAKKRHMEGVMAKKFLAAQKVSDEVVEEAARKMDIKYDARMKRETEQRTVRGLPSYMGRYVGICRLASPCACTC